MDSLVIHAVSLPSAQGFCAGLVEFGGKLVADQYGRYKVEFPLEGGNRQMVALLHALEEYVTHRGDAPARLELSGRPYVLQPSPDPEPEVADSNEVAGEAHQGGSEHQQAPPRPTAEDASRRIEVLRRVYERGYISRVTFEKMKRDIEARVERPRPSRPSESG